MTSLISRSAPPGWSASRALGFAPRSRRSYQRRRGTHPSRRARRSSTSSTHRDRGHRHTRGGCPRGGAVEVFGLSTPPMVSYQDLVTNEGRYYEGQSYGARAPTPSTTVTCPTSPRT